MNTKILTNIRLVDWSLVYLSVGADANVVFQANDFKEKHKFLQKYAYMASIPKALQAGTAFDIGLTARKDGAELKLMDGPYILAALCNWMMYGGGFKINPGGQVSDGLLELVYVQTMPMHKIWAVLYKFFAGNHEDLEELDNVICDEVVYASKDGSPMVLNCDGEIYQLPTFTCQVKKHAYKRII